MHIAFTTPLPSEGFTRLEGHILYADLAEAEVLVSTFDQPVTREMIMSAPHLQLVTNFGVGFNNIDLEACRERGIRVTNTPQPVIEPTAELAFALMHDVARRTAEFDRKLRQGIAEPFGVMNNLSHSLYGKTLGIIGMGRIGQALARRALASGMKVIYHNRKPIDDGLLAIGDGRLAIEYVSKEELLQTADFVSLNLPYTPEVKHIIDSKALRMMKPTAYLINTARGGVIEEEALCEALNEGKLAGAGIDVLDAEPMRKNHPYLRAKNCYITPHVAWACAEARERLVRLVAENLKGFRDGSIINCVNM